MEKILTKLISIKYKINCYKEEKKMLSNINTKLTKEEKNKVNKKNRNILRIMKKMYFNFDNCDYSYFLSDSIFQNEILPKLNDVNYGLFGLRHKYSYFTDKNYQEKFAKNFKFPKAVVRCINGNFYDSEFKYITKDEAYKKIKGYDKLVFKKSLGEGHGRGVKLVENKDFIQQIDKFQNNFVIQELIKQHQFLDNLNSSSVNIIRVTSLLLDGVCYILGSVLRIGAPGAFCDHLGYGKKKPRIVALDEKGNLVGLAISPDDCQIYSDIFGKNIEGKVPNFEKIIDSVKKEHLNFLHHKIIGWDITIDDKGDIVCIEFNSIVPGIVQTQMVCGPIFAQRSVNYMPLLDEIKKMK